MRTQGITYEKAKAFAIAAISLCNELRDKGEYVMSKQLLKAGTSIGANYCEALGTASPQDYVHKLSISLKEANRHPSGSIYFTQVGILTTIGLTL